MKNHVWKDREQEDDSPSPVSPETIEKIRSWLSPTEFDAEGSEYHKHLNSHVPGTGDWLFSTGQFQRWVGSEDIGTLWIKGVPGSGKSVVAADLTRKLSDEKEAPVLFFFSRQILSSNSEPRFLVRDCLYQALDHSLSLQLRLKEVIQEHPEVEHVPFTKLWRMLGSAVPMMHNVYLVFDALDELEAEKDKILELLLRLGQLKPSSVKLILTSRTLPTLRRF